MGRKNKPRLIPKQNQKLCRLICLCQLTLVLSCVSFVYLTVAIYLPSYRAFNSEFETDPVMCQTIRTLNSSNCSWASCGEWCLTSTSGYCPQVFATVRRSGSNVVFENCTQFLSTSCPQVKPTSHKRYNCNNGTECSAVTGFYNCSKGHCARWDDLYLCNYVADGEKLDAERDNVKLNGFFYCNASRCAKVKKPFRCDRYCPTIKTTDFNLYIMEDDTVVQAKCGSAIGLNEARASSEGVLIKPTSIWNATEGKVLITNCAEVFKHDDKLKATDCLNGTLIKSSRLPHLQINFTEFHKLYRNSNELLDPTELFLPRQQTLTIYNSSKLYINLQACVNTLRGECLEFVETHGRDGRNDTAQSRFPCYYNKNESSYVVLHFDLQRTYRDLLIAAIVPAVLFVISFTFLCIITRSVRVGDDTRMRCKYCGDNNSDHETSIAENKRCDNNVIENEPILSASGMQSPIETEPTDLHEHELINSSSSKTLDSRNEEMHTESEILSKSRTTVSKSGDEKLLVIL